MQSLPPPRSQGSIPFSGAKDYGLSTQERTQGMLVWVLSIFAPVVAPLVFLVISTKGSFTYRHAAQSITVSVLYPIVIFLCACTGIGIVLSFLLGFLWLVLQVFGALAANEGRDIDPPVTSGIARAVFGF